MSGKKMLGIALWIAALIAIAGGSFTLLAGHPKTGIGLIILAVIAIAGGLVTFFSRSSSGKEQPDREFM